MMAQEMTVESSANVGRVRPWPSVPINCTYFAIKESSYRRFGHDYLHSLLLMVVVAEVAIDSTRSDRTYSKQVLQ